MSSQKQGKIFLQKIKYHINNNPLYQRIFSFNQKRYYKKIRELNKNKDFTIISNNCVGGFIYKSLGVKYYSPTMWLWMKLDDYLEFVKDLKYYTKCDIVEIPSEYSYPVGQIVPDNPSKKKVTLYFQHYKTFDDAKKKWDKRCQRINYNNIYYIMEFFHTKNDEKLLYEFNNLDLENKLIITHKHYSNIDNQFVCDFKNNDVNDEPGFILKNDGISGKLFLDRFDYVSFLNNKNNK